MDEVEEVSLGEAGALKTVVAEEVGDDGPSVGGGVGGLDDDLENVLGDGGVQPGDYALVDLSPLDVAESHESVDGAIDVIKKTKLAKSKVEGGLPDAKIGLLEVKDNGDMVADVDKLD